MVAKVRHTVIHAEVEELWARPRRGQIELTHQQVHGLAGEIYRAANCRRMFSRSQKAGVRLR